MNGITYICLANSQPQLQHFLLPSISLLQQAGRTCNLLLIDSQSLGAHSAAEALNRAIQIHRPQLLDIVCFLHQDIRFTDTAFHDRLLAELQQDPNQILGCAGVRCGETTRSNLQSFLSRQPLTHLHLDSQTKFEVETLDECCFATSLQLLDQLAFDPQCCFHWHLYAHDLCYNAALHHHSRVFVLPERVFHKDYPDINHPIDLFYVTTLFRMIRKYRHQLNHICASCEPCISTGWRGYIRILRLYIGKTARLLLHLQ